MEKNKPRLRSIRQLKLSGETSSFVKFEQSKTFILLCRDATEWNYIKTAPFRAVFI